MCSIRKTHPNYIGSYSVIINKNDCSLKSGNLKKCSEKKEVSKENDN